MITRAAFVAEARTWLDTPYVHGAQLKGIGVDCIGIVVGSLLALGHPDAEAFANDSLFKGYSSQPDPAKLILACDRYLDRATGFELGDIRVMRFAREPQHFGIVSCVDPLRIIHSLAPVGKVTEHGIDAVWQRRMVRAYQPRGLV